MHHVVLLEIIMCILLKSLQFMSEKCKSPQSRWVIAPDWNRTRLPLHPLSTDLLDRDVVRFAKGAVWLEPVQGWQMWATENPTAATWLFDVNRHIPDVAIVELGYQRPANMARTLHPPPEGSIVPPLMPVVRDDADAPAAAPSNVAVGPIYHPGDPRALGGLVAGVASVGSASFSTLQESDVPPPARTEGSDDEDPGPKPAARVDNNHLPCNNGSESILRDDGSGGSPHDDGDHDDPGPKPAACRNGKNEPSTHCTQADMDSSADV